MSDSVRLHRQQPTKLPRPWDSPGKNTGVGCHFLLQCMKVKSLSHARLLATPWTAAYETPPSMGFSRQEYWSGLPLHLMLFELKICKQSCEFFKISFTVLFATPWTVAYQAPSSMGFPRQECWSGVPLLVDHSLSSLNWQRYVLQPLHADG